MSTDSNDRPKPTRKPGHFNPGRMFDALGRIGYKPVSAIMDITDNSVSWGADRVTISIGIDTAPTSEEDKNRRRAIITSFTIIDNGVGMDEDGLDNALTLGSSKDIYSDESLSKFGLGLKSAAFSLGSQLEIISRYKDDLKTARKVVTSKRLMRETGSYVYDLSEPTEEDIQELNAHCGNSSGTLVRITEIHLTSMPSVTEIEQELRLKASVAYYYYLAGKIDEQHPLILRVIKTSMGTSQADVKRALSDDDKDNEPIKALDPLFLADLTGHLDEYTWNGTEPKWITTHRPIQLALDGSSNAFVEIVQLPHPPTVEDAKIEDTNRKSTLEHFLIGAGNYGFFVYRNHRLISWGDPLGGLFKHSKSLYGFRGRLLIDDSADDLLNIDVAKSRIELSEIAKSQLGSVIGDAVRKSIAAWERRQRILKEKAKDNAHTVVNDALDAIAIIDDKDNKVDETLLPASERHKLEDRRRQAAEQRPANEEESKRLKEEGERVQYVEFLPNNVLWERGHHPDLGPFVRVSKSHRFYAELLSSLEENADLMKVLDTLFFGLARGEFDMVYKSSHPAPLINNIAQDYREHVGNVLSDLVKRMIERKVFDNE